MLTAEIEKLALSLPGTQENAHFGARDFRVGNRIFMAFAATKLKTTAKIAVPPALNG